MKRLINECFFLCIFLSLLSIIYFCAYYTGRVRGINEGQVPQRNLYESAKTLCKDDAKREAWLAYKRGEFRCFHENIEYPHRALGANVSP